MSRFNFTVTGDDLLSPSSDPPNLRLVEHSGKLWLQETTSRKLLNVGNRHLAGLGVWTAQVHGVKYYPDAEIQSNLRPCALVTLVREPQNPHDANAIAVQTDHGTVGLINQQMAERVAKRLDAGEHLAAVSLAGAAPGLAGIGVRVLAAKPALLAHLQRMHQS